MEILVKEKGRFAMDNRLFVIYLLVAAVLSFAISFTAALLKAAS